MPYKDKEKQKEYQRNWVRRNRRDRKEEHRIWYLAKKIQAYEILGGKCVYCGCTDIDALEINHIHGGGRKEPKHGKALYLDIISGKRTTEDLELTCRICNAWHYLVHIKNIKDGWKITWRV